MDLVSNNESTFFQNIVVNCSRCDDPQASSIAVDVTGSMVALGIRKGLYLVDLENPWDKVKILNHNSKNYSKWEVSAVEWNPAPSHSHIIASTSNQHILIWEAIGTNSVNTVLTGHHERSVSDISWSYHDPNILASCSQDTYIHLWDIRIQKTPTASLCAVVGVTQVKWNRLQQNIIASAHNSEVCLWDVR
jgi:WD40 repeat protein